MQHVIERVAFLVLWCVSCAAVERVPSGARAGAARQEAGQVPAEAWLAEAEEALKVGERLFMAGRYAEVVPLVERALVLRGAVLGEAHPQVADFLDLLGILQYQQREYARAEPLYERALEIKEAALGPSHPEVATTLNYLVLVYKEQGQYARAVPLCERALAIREAALGPSHPHVADTLSSLAGLHWKQGQYAQAGSLYERALTIQEAALGPGHPEVATALNNLANLYHEQGQYARAMPLLERALAIQEVALGPGHPQVAAVLSNLASLYGEQGQYSRAEPLLERALAVQEAAPAQSQPEVAVALNNLANLYREQGQYARAEPLLERALAIQEAALGPGHPDVAAVLNNLASLYSEQDQYSQAEPLLERALTIQEAALGPSHPDVATSLGNLASVYWERGQYARAEPLYERALAIREAALGPCHPDVARSLNNLALLHQQQGRYEQARPLLERALAIRESALGPNHPDVARSFGNLAFFYLVQQRLTEAFPLYGKALHLSEEYLRNQTLALSEARLEDFLRLFQSGEWSIYALLRERPGDARVRRLALATALLRKGRSAEELAGTSRTISRHLHAEEQETFEQLRSLRTLFAELSLAGPGDLAPADYQRRLREFAEQGDALETRLARRSAPLRALRGVPLPGEIVDRVAGSLPRNGALVEFIAWNLLLQAKPGTPRLQVPSEPRYLALVLFPAGRTAMVDLGPAAPIDQVAQRLRGMLSTRNIAWQPAAEELYQLAFRPLLPVLGKTRRLFLAPDGQLSLVPFDALHDGSGFLFDRFELTYLTSGKELLPRPEDISPEDSVVVLADPDFGAEPAEAPTGDAPAERSPSLERLFATLRGPGGDTPWVPLPGTRQEAEAIQRLLPQARLLLGREATKQALLELPTPGLLHIATHGFFYDEDSGREPGMKEGGAATARPAGFAHLLRPGHLSEGTLTPLGRGAVESVGAAAGPRRPGSPLLRSGLVLAGALASESDSSAPRYGDSLATALELAGMDLWGTQLVVLSACDTALGDVKLGQGVYGLRRALGVAGAETVVMSLWRVNDEVTRQLMEDYYRRLLAGEGRARALREAMRAVREEHPHPSYWASFLSVGQTGPLRGIAPQGGTAKE